MHRADLRVAHEFAEGFLHVQQPFVVPQNLLGGTPFHRFVGMEQLPAVLLHLLAVAVSRRNWPISISLSLHALSSAAAASAAFLHDQAEPEARILARRGALGLSDGFPGLHDKRRLSGLGRRERFASVFGCVHNFLSG
jgi:hypothetical protein